MSEPHLANILAAEKNAQRAALLFILSTKRESVKRERRKSDRVTESDDIVRWSKCSRIPRRRRFHPNWAIKTRKVIVVLRWSCHFTELLRRGPWGVENRGEWMAGSSLIQNSRNSLFRRLRRNSQLHRKKIHQSNTSLIALRELAILEESFFLKLRSRFSNFSVRYAALDEVQWNCIFKAFTKAVQFYGRLTNCN